MDFVHSYTKNKYRYFSYVLFKPLQNFYIFFEVRGDNPLNNFLELSRRIKDPLPKVFVNWQILNLFPLSHLIILHSKKFYNH